MQAITTANLLRRGMRWESLTEPLRPHAGHCVMTGAAITEGYPVQEILPSSTGNFLDILPGGATGWLSEDAAVCYRNDFRLGARLIFEDGTMLNPLVDARAAAEQGRPCWRDVVRDVLPGRVGERHICLLNTDYKKRVWPRTPVTTVGGAMRWYVYDPSRGVAAAVRLSLTQMAETLALVEEVLVEFPKPRIELGLHGDAKGAKRVGWTQICEWESRLRELRSTSEFGVAMIIAQKGIARV